MYVVWKLLILSICFASCRTPSNDSAITKEQTYIYLSHTSVKNNDSVFKKVYDIDLSKYDMTLLGGDISLKTFENDVIFNHVDSIFNFKKPTTLWSVGNHDRTSDSNFKERTGKNKYHYYKRDDISFITLDTQDSLSNIIGDQKIFLRNTLDTLTSNNVIIMVHKLIFMDKHPVMDPLTNLVVNGQKGNCYYCHNPNNFQEEIYPMLLKLKKEGKNILMIGGDLGYKTSSFEYIDKNGIIFLGNGLSFQNTNNEVLLLSKTKENLSYNFTPLDSLLKRQHSQ